MYLDNRLPAELPIVAEIGPLEVEVHQFKSNGQSRVRKENFTYGFISDFLIFAHDFDHLT